MFMSHYATEVCKCPKKKTKIVSYMWKKYYICGCKTIKMTNTYT